MASGARSRTTAALPAWSGWLWVRITCPTAGQPSERAPSAASMASALFSTPVSTRAASPPRARRYADTNPRFTRLQARAPAALDAVADTNADGEAPAPGEDAPPEGAGVVAPADGAAGEQAATPRIATTKAPRPRSVTNVRRSM